MQSQVYYRREAGQDSREAATNGGMLGSHQTPEGARDGFFLWGLGIPSGQHSETDFGLPAYRSIK